MSVAAGFEDGAQVSAEVFGILAKFAPDGVMDVLACDQHNSVLRLLKGFFKQARAAGGSGDEYPETPSDDDVARASEVFARRLGRVPAAALFNHLAYLSKGFREALGADTMLIGRLEDTNFVETADGKGLIPQLAVEPEQVADRVDGFKTLVKVDPAHRESWDKNLEWIQQVWERCRKAGRPLFNETLYTPADLSKVATAQRLPEVLPKIARDFGAYGEFYKTQVPMLWADEDGTLIPISSPETIRRTTEAMTAVVDRPVLLLSAAVNFEQYAAQYGIVCDLVAGPMCGRAYFKDPFSNPEVKDWKSLEQAVAMTALPRMQQIQALAAARSRPWWHKFTWMSDEAKGLIRPRAEAVAAAAGARDDRAAY